jgi:hypothetical protein
MGRLVAVGVRVGVATAAIGALMTWTVAAPAAPVVKAVAAPPSSVPVVTDPRADGHPRQFLVPVIAAEVPAPVAARPQAFVSVRWAVPRSQTSRRPAPVGHGNPGHNGINCMSQGCLPPSSYVPNQHGGVPGVNGKPCTGCQGADQAVWVRSPDGYCMQIGAYDAAKLNWPIDPTCPSGPRR